MTQVRINTGNLKEFAENARKASRGLRKYMEELLEDIGWEILAIFQEEVEKSGSIDTGKLFDSFFPGAEGNVWELDTGGLKITVGTDIDYAKYVNDGHWMNPQGVSSRWVPGHWEGKHFYYEPGSPTGMCVKQQFIEGKHFLEATVKAMEIMIPDYLEEKLQEYFDRYFGG